MDEALVPVPVFEDGIELLTEPITMKHLGGYVTDQTGDMEPLCEYPEPAERIVCLDIWL